MLAHTMGGAPLSRAHGAPMRLVIPEMYGYKNVKWLHRIELVPEPAARASGSRTAMTSTPGSAVPTATERSRPAPVYVRRFWPEERSLHWLLAVTFLIMLATGLILYLPVVRRSWPPTGGCGSRSTWAPRSRSGPGSSCCS